jgi:hypothetical protein
VNNQVRTWRPALRVLALALALAAVPLPALAGEPSQPAAKPGIRASIQQVAAQQVAASARLTPPRAQYARTQEGKAQLGSGSFFKTSAGIACLAVLAAGTGYAFYSKSHDRIHSVTRQSQ